MYLEVELEPDDRLARDAGRDLGRDLLDDVGVLLPVAAVEELGEGAHVGAHDPEEVVERAEEVAADEQEAGDVDVEKEPGVGHQALEDVAVHVAVEERHADAGDAVVEAEHHGQKQGPGKAKVGSQ